VRRLGGNDPDRCRTIMQWRLADALAAYEAEITETARRGYEFEVLIWAVLAQSGAGKKQPPKPPDLLRN